MIDDGAPFFSPLDRRFAGLMADLARRWPGDVATAAALASRAVGQGSVCLDLSKWAATTIPHTGTTPDLALWRSRLMDSGMVGPPGAVTPLVLDAEHRLYLRRYWAYEQRTAEALLRRAENMREHRIDTMAGAVSRLFGFAGKGDFNPTDWQAVAACVAALKGLCILSGGPGTGKTYTAVRIMALLQALSDRPLRMVMAAPTGKAASRLMASLTAARGEGGAAADLFAAVPATAATLHRLLGIRPGDNRPRHHRDNPISADVVVIDEASMIDISLMCRLLEAVPPAATLVLIGDRHQLSSVEAGAVFGDICRTAEGSRFSPAMQTALVKVMPTPPPEDTGAGGLSDCLVFLDRAHRFAAGSGLGRLFEAVNAGDAAAVCAALEAGYPDISWHYRMAPRECHSWLRPHFERRRQELTADADPKKALARLGHWQVLCALNKGPWGVSAINQIAEAAAGNENHGRHGRLDGDRWYPGMPVMVMQNDYELGLYNGDMGIVLEETAGETIRLRAHFGSQDGRITGVAPLRLPAHEPAHALTVHKSQGSEFTHVVLILPDRDVPVLSRELVYTGMTRTATALTVIAPPDILETAVCRTIIRPSGLAEALWKTP